MLEEVISNFIEEQFPQIYREEGPFFVQFLTEYYKWMESDSHSPIYNARRHLSNKDIDTTVDDFVLFYKEKYLKNIQINTATNTKQLIKNSSSLYRAKGTENAIKLFFDLIFSADSEVYYPGTDVFRLSDAGWVVPRYLEITSTPLNRLFVGRAITGINSGATAFVERLVRRKVKNNYIEVIYISAISGNFRTGEIIRLSSAVNENYDANPRIIGSLTQLEVLDGGEGFSKGEVVTLESKTGSQGRAIVDSLSSITGIVDFSLDDGGWGYTVNTNIYVSEKVLQLSNVHVTSTANISLVDKIINIVQPMANVQWYNNSSFFSTSDTLYNYYANGTLIGVNNIISAEYGTNTSTNFFLLNTISGNNYMDPSAPYYYTSGNTSSFQVQSGGWANNTATGTSVGMSSNVLVYCTGDSNTFSVGDVAYQVSANGVLYANSTIREMSVSGPNTFSMKVNGLNGLFLTNQPLISLVTSNTVSITSISYDIGIRNVTNSFRALPGSYIIDTANTSQWNATINRISFGSGANTSFDPNLLNSEIISLNTNYVRDHMNETINTNWVNAAAYGANLNFANLTNMTLGNALMFQTKILGTIGALKNKNPGALYTYPPFVDPIDPLVAPLNLQDYVIRISDSTGIFGVGEEVTQSSAGAKGAIKFANTSEIHVRRLTFADRWQVGNTTPYLIIGTASGHAAYPTEVTYDIADVAGHNAVINTKVTSSNSTATSLIVTDSGFAFNNGDEISFTSKDGIRTGSALGTVNKQGFGDGYYKTTSGFLSSNKYLFDGYYYQDLSYEIRSPISADRYSAMLKSILHVSGTKVFSAIKKKILAMVSLLSHSWKHQFPTPSTIPPVNSVLPVITGTAQDGNILTCSTGTWMNNPTSFSYQWQRNGTNISGANSSTYTIVSADVGNLITCVVVAINNAGYTPATAAGVTPAARIPSNTSIPIISGSAQDGSTLSCSTGSWSYAPTSFSYQWKRGGGNISGATASTYVIVTADVGQSVTCVVTATNSAGSASATSNTVTPAASAAPPINTTAPALSGTAQTGQVLGCSTGTWLNTPTSYAYQWKRNGTNISGATSSTYTLIAADVGTTVICVVTATNANGSTPANSNSVTPIDLAPVNTGAPAITGTAQKGQVLTCSTGTWNNTPTSYAYQWQRNGTNISGATASTYTLAAADVDNTIICIVTATNSGGSTSANSNAVIPIDIAPVNTVAPALSGTAQKTQTLTCSTGTWTNNPTSYTYQWKRNSVNIAGATNSTYVLTNSDVGTTITCTVTAINSGGSTSATSNGVVPIDLAPVNTVAPALSGTAQKGQVLTCSTGTWNNGPTGYAYQWKRNGVNISGATSSTYTLVASDVSTTIICTVTATNTGGSVAADSNTVTPIDLAPVNTVAPALSGTAQTGQVMSCSTGTWNNTPTSYAYQWKRNGTNISGATASTYTLVAADVSQPITCTVTATNTGGSVSVTSNTVTPIDLAPVSTVSPAITGSAFQGGTLTCSTGTWNNTPTSYAYQWKRNGTNISGATSSTYVVVSADVGQPVTCAVTATNTGGSTSATSNTVTPSSALPTNTVAPAVTGDSVVGQMLFASTGTWTGSPTSYSYQWFDTNGAIPSATSDNYLITDVEVGLQIYCKVSATNGSGTSSPTSSASTSAVTDIDLSTQAPVLTRTSASGATPYMVDSALGNKTYQGYTIRRQIASDNGYVTMLYEGQLVLTEAMLQSPYNLDWTKAVPPYSEPNPATYSQYYERQRVEAQTPIGTPKNSSWSSTISKTDAFVPVILDSSHKTSGMTLSGGSLTATSGGGGGPETVYTNRGVVSGRKVYFEVLISALGSTNRIAITDGVPSLTSWWDGGQGVHALEWDPAFGGLNYNGTQAYSSGLYDYTTGDRLELALNTTIGAQKLWVRKNGGSWLSGDPVAGTGGFALTGIGGGNEIFPAVQGVGSSVTVFAFLSTSWVHAAPTGFSQI